MISPNDGVLSSGIARCCAGGRGYRRRCFRARVIAIFVLVAVWRDAASLPFDCRSTTLQVSHTSTTFLLAVRLPLIGALLRFPR